jgi:(p)ppGpp synthase/HD superfamily hydrolase
MSKSLNIEFEKAVRILAEYMPPSDENSRKPIMFHDIRVGVYLYEQGYSQDIVLAGVLHDTIEWSGADLGLLRKEFGDNVVQLILASTKDDSILEKEEKTNELIKRCIENGQDALIVKTADIIDSFKWYSAQNNEDELKNHCVKNADVIFKFKPTNFEDKIFDELRIWKEKYSV